MGLISCLALPETTSKQVGCSLMSSNRVSLHVQEHLGALPSRLVALLKLIGTQLACQPYSNVLHCRRRPPAARYPSAPQRGPANPFSAGRMSLRRCETCLCRYASGQGRTSTCIPFRAKFMPRLGSGISGGTSSAGRATSQVPS